MPLGKYQERKFNVCDEQNVTQIATEILDYLNKHSKASDTLEGIAHWWLTKQVIARHLNLVEVALDDLVRKGVLDVRENEETGVLYFFNKRNLT